MGPGNGSGVGPGIQSGVGPGAKPGVGPGVGSGVGPGVSLQESSLVFGLGYLVLELVLVYRAYCGTWRGSRKWV